MTTKKTRIVLPLLLCACLLNACDQAADAGLKDIIKTDLGYLPVISAFTLASPTPSNVRKGTVCRFDLRYWSEGTIAKTTFSARSGTGTPVVFLDRNYTPAYSRVTRTDSLLVDYTVPAEAARGTRIRIEATVINAGLEAYPRTAFVELNVVE